jgi:hypothetical protein
MKSLEHYGFAATEYHSQGGYGGTMLRRTSRGWVASVWRDGGRGYVPVTAASETLEGALAAYDAWVHAPADNQQEF